MLCFQPCRLKGNPTKNNHFRTGARQVSKKLSLLSKYSVAKTFIFISQGISLFVSVLQ